MSPGVMILGRRKVDQSTTCANIVSVIEQLISEIVCLTVLCCDTVNKFKFHLEKLWQYQDIV